VIILRKLVERIRVAVAACGMIPSKFIWNQVEGLDKKFLEALTNLCIIKNCMCINDSHLTIS
jgi:hypothetical protein